MRHTPTATGDQLTNALRMLGVKFVLGRQNKGEALHEQPARLIAALAESREARLRLSLIPLFLEHPEFATHVRKASEGLAPSARLTLQCYYSAAIWLGQKYLPHKKATPDLFSEELGLTLTDDAEENLCALAKRHQELSGAHINWLGTYQHAAQVWLMGLELQKD
jgi:hypothetical protein